jgi:serine/threonine protein kinase
MALTSGTKLGPYEIIAPLGAGGMGEVYQARDTRLDRTVAIKILPSHLSEDVTRRQRFEREAKAVSSLNHPHICTLYDIGRQDGVDFIVMEYVEGVTLAARLEKGPLPTAEVLEYGIQLASALDKAHRNRVTHRDLKPGNIMLTKSGAKLLDFGLAKSASLPTAVATLVDAASPVTLEGVVVGTVPYMSPEQVEGKEVDARSDIFSLGAVLYEMVTGGRAFQGASDFSVASAILVRDPEPISTLQPLTPLALQRTIRVCLVGGRSLQGTAVDRGGRVAKRSGNADCGRRTASHPSADRVDSRSGICRRGTGRAAARRNVGARSRADCFPPVKFRARSRLPGCLRGERHRGVQRRDIGQYAADFRGAPRLSRAETARPTGNAVARGLIQG